LRTSGLFEETGSRPDAILQRRFGVASHRLLLRFTHPLLESILTPALAHLRIDGRDSEPELTITVTEGEAPAAELELLARFDGMAGDEGVGGDRRIVNPVNYYRDGSLQLLQQTRSGIVSLLDVARKRAMYRVPDARHLPDHEHDRPLRYILSWWSSSLGLQMIHGSAAATPDGAALMVGGSGSGKSTAALACLDRGLDFLGDEYVLVGLDPEPTVHCLYSSGRIGVEDARRFPRLRGWLDGARIVDPAKAMLFLHALDPERLAGSRPIRAILVPRIGDRDRPRISAVSPATVLKACAPSTIFQQPGSGRTHLGFMAELVRRVPGYALELGEDRLATAEAIAGLLSGLER